MGEDWPNSSRAENKWSVVLNASQHSHEALKKGFCCPGMVKITDK